MTTILLHGAGKEAAAAAAHFAALGDKPLLYDDAGGSLSDATSVSLAEARSALPGALYLRSPGVPPSNTLVQEAATKAALATTPTGYWLTTFAPAGTITVTGTKGKSTTTALLTSILQEAGISSAAYGNIGSPPLGPEPVTETHPVVEVSSYMMHDLPPTDHLHLITTLFKEHTDWHGGEAAYRAAKLKPFRQATPAPGLAPRALIEKEGLPSSVTAVEDKVIDDGAHLVIGETEIDLGDRTLGFHDGPLREALRISLAAASTIVAADHLKPAAERAVRAWRGLPCRQELIDSSDGRLWVVDTLATIPEATIAAMDRFRDQDLRLILGGTDRGQDFQALLAHLDQNTKHRAFCYGPISAKLTGARVTEAPDLEAAISVAADDCPAGGVILFSPAAPSSPPHTTYAERAAIFRGFAERA